MNILIISIEHPLQLLEADSDTEALRASKLRLRRLIEQRIARGSLMMIFEESKPAKLTIAAQLASQSEPKIPWHNIVMTEQERKAAGIFDASLNRPAHPDLDDDMPIVHRIPEDSVREQFFVNKILTVSASRGDVLVLLGDMHVVPVADLLRLEAHTIEICSELVPVKRWE